MSKEVEGDDCDVEGVSMFEEKIEKELSAEAEQSMIAALRKGDLTQIRKVATECELSQVELLCFAMRKTSFLIRDHLFQSLSEERLEEVLVMPEIKSEAITLLRRELQALQPGGVENAISFFKIPKKVILSEEMQESARKSILGCLKIGGRRAAQVLMRLFQISEDFFSTQESLDAAREGKAHLSGLQTSRREELVKEFEEFFTERGLEI